MPSSYIRRLGARCYRNYTPEMLGQAVDGIIKGGISYRKAVIKYNIPKITLQRYHEVDKSSPIPMKPSRYCRTSLSEEEEQTLISHIKSMTIMGFPMNIMLYEALILTETSFYTFIWRFMLFIFSMSLRLNITKIQRLL